MTSGTNTHLRRIRLIRHGSAEPSRFGQSDYTRPLDQSGLDDLHSTAQQLRTRKENTADWLWTSPAARTLATARTISTACQCPMRSVEDLYLANPESILSILQTTSDDFQDVILVGHNPGISVLAGLLGNPTLTIKLAPLGIADLTFTSSWQDVNFGRCKLVANYDLKAHT